MPIVGEAELFIPVRSPINWVFVFNSSQELSSIQMLKLTIFIYLFLVSSVCCAVEHESSSNYHRFYQMLKQRSQDYDNRFVWFTRNIDSNENPQQNYQSFNKVQRETRKLKKRLLKSRSLA